MPESTEKNLLAGHAPATIVGGMRVSQGKHHEKEAPANKYTDISQDTDGAATDDSNVSADATTAVSQASQNTIIVNSVPVRIEDAFPTEAVKHAHDKPMPTHDKQAHNNKHDKCTTHINQPRK